MDVSSKRALALLLLEKTGIWRSNYAPPFVRLLWRLGIDVPPPHFATFAGSACVAGGFFGALWGLFMWLFVWSNSGMMAMNAAVAALITGVFFGLAMASYYAYGRYRYKLPSWHELDASPSGT